MARRSKTAVAIQEEARRQFNAKGYAITTLSDIAAGIGISQGNLTYHYPTKRDLVTSMQEQVAERVAARRAEREPGNVEDDYVARLQLLMELTAHFRFLLRDDAQIEPGPDHQTPHRILVDDYATFAQLLERTDDAGLFRQDIETNVDQLTRSLWILSRYWMDHLSEMGLQPEPTATDQRRGIEHNLQMLLPNLSAAGRRRFQAALDRAVAAEAEERS